MAQTKPLEDQLRDAKRTLLLYRLGILVVIAVFAALAWKLSGTKVSNFGYAGTIWTVDLPERYAITEKEHGSLADFSETYFKEPDATVHMHFMGHLQTTPMHLHPVSSEATIIAGGVAEVEHVWGENGTFATRTGTYEKGSLVGSPPYTGHEFHNPNADAMLANLVFTMPQFGGNFYVRRDDVRLLQGPAPYTSHPADDVPAFAATNAAFKLEKLPAMQGRMYELLVSTSWTLPANPGKPVIAYVAAGEGEVAAHVLRSGILAHLEATTPTTLTARSGSPMALVLFDPHDALAGAPSAP